MGIRLAPLCGAAGFLAVALTTAQPSGAETPLERGTYLMNGLVAYLRSLKPISNAVQ
jgi:hypothetical protein